MTYSPRPLIPPHRRRPRARTRAKAVDRRPWAFLALLGALLALLLAAAVPAQAATNQTKDPFWAHWSDGKAELDGYRLVQPRYGQLREGRAVLIYVTEPFSRSKRVKVDRYDSKSSDQLTVLKLNHVRKFQTGIYDYSLMTSLFTDPDKNFAPLKINLSSQEWCGNLYHELAFFKDHITSRVFSYFEGESSDERLQADSSVLAEDNLFIQLRNLRSTELPTGTTSKKMLLSATTSRLAHKPMQTFDTEIVWSQKPMDASVPAGTFKVREAQYTRLDGSTCTFQVEQAYPHRIIRWTCQDGETGELTGSERRAYWAEHGEGEEAKLSGLGLEPMQVAPTSP